MILGFSSNEGASLIQTVTLKQQIKGEKGSLSLVCVGRRFNAATVETGLKFRECLSRRRSRLQDRADKNATIGQGEINQYVSLICHSHFRNFPSLLKKKKIDIFLMDDFAQTLLVDSPD